MTSSGLVPVITTLAVQSFRCLHDQRIDFGARANWIVGDNAAGKTSLLEAVYWLCRGRSFRGARAAQCARHGENHWTVAARRRQDNTPEERLRLRFADAALQYSLNDAPTTLVEQARDFPVQLVEPGVHRLVEDGPTYRRRFLDWGMFHVEPAYLDGWRRYARALRQRNALLRKAGSVRELQAWSHEVAAAGEALHAARRQGVIALQEAFARRCETFGLPTATLQLQSGWDDARSLLEVLEDRVDSDRRTGHTGAGPHRAELRMDVDEYQARAHISRGQQKVLLAALHLAQADQLSAATDRWPLLLLDDFTAELADRLQRALAAALAAYPGQSIVTSLTRPAPEMLGDGATMFHVEHCRVLPAQ